MTIENDRNCKKIKILKKESVRNNTEYPRSESSISFSVSHFHFFWELRIQEQCVFATLFG